MKAAGFSGEEIAAFLAQGKMTNLQDALPCEAMKPKKVIRFFQILSAVAEDIARSARDTEKDLLAIEQQRKLKKRRARFPWPDVNNMGLEERMELAQVLYKHGRTDAAVQVAPPGASIGYSPPNPRVQAAVRDAINAMRQGIPAGYWCRIHGDACPDRRPPPPPPAPPVERIIVSYTKLHAADPALLDRIKTIPHKVRGRDVGIFSVPTLIEHGFGPAELATLRLCSVGTIAGVAVSPAEEPAVDPSQGDKNLRLVELELGEVGGKTLGLRGGVADRCGRATTTRPATLLRPGLRSTSKGIDMDEKTLARFEAKIQRSDECHEWLAAKDQDGYGIFQLNRRARRAHHIAYALANGISPDGLYLLHSCDNPSCVNPDHLAQGDNRINTADRHAKGRDARGERNGHPKLNEAAVRDCFRRYRGGESQRSIARVHGISQTLIRMVLTRKVWKHIDV